MKSLSTHNIIYVLSTPIVHTGIHTGIHTNTVL
jgi:hypothetical protein